MDAKKLCYVDETGVEMKTFNYKVKFHMTDGKIVTVMCNDQKYDKENFTDSLCLCKFAILEGGSKAINLRQVLYIEVKEIIND